MSTRGVRVIPKLKDPITRFAQIGLERKWNLKKAVARDPATRTPGEVASLVPESETWVILRDDLYAGIHFFHVRGPDEERIAADLREEFDAWTAPELFAWWDRGVAKEDVDDRVDAVLFLGVNTPYQPEEEYVKRIRAGLADPEKDVRNAAVAATAYADWRVFRPDLERLADTDPDDQARRSARYILDGWSKEDAGEGASA
jgi:hypothetical protein